MTILERLPVTDKHWRDKAMCLGEDLEDFFPDSNDMRARRRAMALCAICPVRSDCLIDALNFDDDMPQGIRAGLGMHERRELRKQIGAPRARRQAVLPHGYDEESVYRAVRNRNYPPEQAARLLGMTVDSVHTAVSRGLGDEPS